MDAVGAKLAVDDEEALLEPAAIGDREARQQVLQHGVAGLAGLASAAPKAARVQYSP